MNKLLFFFAVIAVVHATFDLETCTITSKYDLYTYNFSPLMSKTFTFTQKDKSTLYLRLCSVEPKCGNGMTACTISETENRGLGKAELTTGSDMKQRDIVIFNAEGGDVVDGKSTAIAIMATCDANEEGIIEDAYTQEKGNYIVKLSTKYACPETAEPGFDVKSCRYITKDEYIFDLAPLMGVSLTYTDKLFRNTFKINTCTSCGIANQAICITTYDNKNVGGGSLDTVSAEEFTYHEVGHTQSGVAMSFGGGDVCPGSDTPRKTHITYLCDKDVEHEVTQVNQGNCYYFITIKTKYACKVN